MFEKPLILAVDDEADFLEIASVYLGSSGFRIETLSSISEDGFLRRCEELQPALVLLDIYYHAEPNGLSFAAALKSNPATAHIKVILWSSVPAPRNAPGDDFFNKSGDLSLLLQKIESHLAPSETAAFS